MNRNDWTLFLQCERPSMEDLVNFLKIYPFESLHKVHTLSEIPFELGRDKTLQRIAELQTTVINAFEQLNTICKTSISSHATGHKIAAAALKSFQMMKKDIDSLNYPENKIVKRFTSNLTFQFDTINKTVTPIAHLLGYYPILHKDCFMYLELFSHREKAFLLQIWEPKMEETLKITRQFNIEIDYLNLWEFLYHEYEEQKAKITPVEETEELQQICRLFKMYSAISDVLHDDATDPQYTEKSITKVEKYADDALNLLTKKMNEFGIPSWEQIEKNEQLHHPSRLQTGKVYKFLGYLQLLFQTANLLNLENVDSPQAQKCLFTHDQLEAQYSQYEQILHEMMKSVGISTNEEDYYQIMMRVTA